MEELKDYALVGRWEMAVVLSEDSQARQVSFVNSICTTKGGTHVKSISDMLVSTFFLKSDFRFLSLLGFSL